MLRGEVGDAAMNALGTKKSHVVKAKVVHKEPKPVVAPPEVGMEREEKAKAAFPDFWESLPDSEKERFSALKKTL